VICRFNGNRLLPIIFVTAVIAGCEPKSASSPPEQASITTDLGPVVVYAQRKAVDLDAILGAYRAETGARYRIRSGDASTHNAQGDESKADLIIANSFAEIWSAAEADALRPVFSDTIERNIDTVLRDPESRWIALSLRARVVVYNTDLVAVEELNDVQTYAALGEDAWRGKLCLSTSKVAGNQSLVAFLIRRYDNREAEIVVRKWRANLATTVFDDDDALLQAVASGSCVLGIADSSKLAALQSVSNDVPVGVHWFRVPGEQFLDISAAGVGRHAANPAAAALLLEWLSSDAANALFATREYEFPANEDSPPGLMVSAWAQHAVMQESIADLGFLQEDALKLIERARYP